MLSVMEVAKRYGVSRDTVLSWIKSGELAATDVSPAGSKRYFWRIGDEALREFELSRNTLNRSEPDPLPPVKQYV